MTTSDQPAGIIPTTRMRKCANTLEIWPCVMLASITSPEVIADQTSQHCREQPIQDNMALAEVRHCTLLVPKASSRKQKVNPRQSETHEVTQLPVAITKHSSRTWPAQQVSRASLARYLSFQQRCYSFFQKCCLLKQTGQIVVEMLRECQSAKCQKDFD